MTEVAGGLVPDSNSMTLTVGRFLDVFEIRTLGGMMSSMSSMPNARLAS